MIDNITECSIIKKVVGKKRAIFMVMQTLPPPQFEDKFATKESLCLNKNNILNQNSEKCLIESENIVEQQVNDTMNEIKSDLLKNHLQDTTTKKCTKCLVVKPFSEFAKDSRGKRKYNVSSDCKKCHNKHYLNNKEVYKKRNQTNYKKNKNKILEQCTQYYLNNKQKINCRNNKYGKIWRKNNRSKIKEKDKKYRLIPLVKLKGNVRNRINNWLKETKFKKPCGTEKLLGCSYQQCKEHLEKQFTDGMTWSNHGQYGWHIDHIVPLSSAKTQEDLHRLCHYTNLQPLWWHVNLSKGNR